MWVVTWFSPEGRPVAQKHAHGTHSSHLVCVLVVFGSFSYIHTCIHTYIHIHDGMSTAAVKTI